MMLSDNKSIIEIMHFILKLGEPVRDIKRILILITFICTGHLMK